MLNLLFGFDGRASRGAWWMAQFLVIPVIYILGFGLLFGMASGTDDANAMAMGGSMLVVILLALALATWINLAVTAKRFHDRGKSGAWTLIILVPFIGTVWHFVECGFCSGDYEENRYGPPPGRAAREAAENAGSSNTKLAKLDDDYFRNYARQAQTQPQRLSEPVVQSTYARPASTVSAPGYTGARPTFGRR